MISSLALLTTTRSAAGMAGRRRAPMVVFRAFTTPTESKHPDPHGEMESGYLEFLDEMIVKTSAIEDSMASLKETYDKKQKLAQTVKWTDPAEMEYLFDMARKQKEEIREQLEQMKATMEAAKTNYAVDAPDGTSDGRVEEEMEEVAHIIDEAAQHGKSSSKS